MIKKDYPQEPTDEAKVDSSLYDAELIGEKEKMTWEPFIFMVLLETLIQILK